MNKRLRNTSGLDKSILVVDRGMISAKNVKRLDLYLQPYVLHLDFRKRKKKLSIRIGRMKKYVIGHSEDIEEQSAAGFEASFRKSNLSNPQIIYRTTNT